MNSIDQQFVEYVIKALVNHPEKVEVKRTIDEKGVLLELTVDPEDLGRVIGKHGITAQSIRTLLRALGTKNDARYNLKIVDNSDHEHHPKYQNHASEEVSDNRSEGEKLLDTINDQDTTSDQENTNNDTTTTSTDRFEKTRKELAEFDDLDV
jgi:predicted RNA-binding protein YlqC (UPF0109 family)